MGVGITAALGATGTLTADVYSGFNRSAALSGAGVLSATIGITSDQRTAALAGSGVLTAVMGIGMTAALSARVH